MENIVQNFKYRKDKRIKNAPYQNGVQTTKEGLKEKRIDISKACTKDEFIKLCKQNGETPDNYIILCNYNIWNRRSKKIEHKHTVVCKTSPDNNWLIDQLYIIEDLPSKFNYIGVSLPKRNNNADAWECIKITDKILQNKTNCPTVYPYLKLIQKNARIMVYNTIIDDIKNTYNDNINTNIQSFKMLGMELVPYIKEYQPVYSEKNEGFCCDKQVKEQLCKALDALEVDYTRMSLSNFVNKYKNIHEDLCEKSENVYAL